MAIHSVQFFRSVFSVRLCLKPSYLLLHTSSSIYHDKSKDDNIAVAAAVHSDSTRRVVKKKTAKLQTSRGTRDYHPEEMIARRKVFDVIESVFHLHGAGQIETPVFELKEIFASDFGEASKQIYNIEDEVGQSSVALRYDLTVPFARYIGQHKIDNMTRYQMSRVYRRDNPTIVKGRYCEFYQCDFDIAGLYAPMVADAECVQVMHQVLTRLRLGDFTIKINHRKLLDGLFSTCGVPSDKFRLVCSAVDKLSKCSWSDVRKELVEERGLEPATADLIGCYVKMSGTEQLLTTLKEDERLKNNENVQSGIAELELLFEYLRCLECSAKVVVDMSLARGLDYYTGLIYEAVLHSDKQSENTDINKMKGKTTEHTQKKCLDSSQHLHADNINSCKKDNIDNDDMKRTKTKGKRKEQWAVGSVAGGGRYDDLVAIVDPKRRSVPCVGVSFGIERLFVIQENKLREEDNKRRTTTLAYVASPCKDLLRERLQLVALLHEAGIPAETVRKPSQKFLDQLQYAEQKAIPLVVHIGYSEIEAGLVKVRNTITREEVDVARSDLVKHLQKLLPQLQAQHDV